MVEAAGHIAFLGAGHAPKCPTGNGRELSGHNCLTRKTQAYVSHNKSVARSEFRAVLLQATMIVAISYSRLISSNCSQ